MTTERNMAVVTVLKKIIKLYEETTFIPQLVSFSNEKLRIQSSNLTGELLAYYQHIEFDKDLFFANQNFNIVLLPLDSPARTVESWALQDVLQFSEGQYQIFATTDTDDILFCDMIDEKSPVYAGSPGDPNFYKLSASLTEFFEFYFAFSNFWGQREDVPLEDYIAGTGDLIERYLSPDVQAIAKEYLFR
ncbi:hypothetical protein FJR71_00595 [Streptococcus xiaochunlingii]|uniref:SMI1/KNR4 family protein n=2 Tax=Streptococcus xiaochunlingii TaxID=2589788 RepID=A0ABY2YII1_9STRE|nr:hypothetical protein FJR71_00595 [Streptococcus xiaochunlingii]